jgi:hypothetical protein
MTDATPMTVFPYRPRDWVFDGRRVAKVKSVWEDRGEVLLDLVFYDYAGNVVGRESDPMGGPRTFEPACSAEHWQRITEPSFPIALRWVQAGEKRVAQFVAGDPLPPAQWKKPKRRARFAKFVPDDRLPPAQWKKPKRRARFAKFVPDDRLRRALKEIADGHNDPRTLAKEVLGNF